MLIEYRTRLPGLSLRNILRNVDLSFEQLAKLCGVSRRQLAYWIRNGIVPAPGDDPFLTVERAALIRCWLRQGDTLRHAVERVDEYYQRHRHSLDALKAMSEEERIQQLTFELAELQSEVGRLRQRLSDASSPALDARSLMGVLRNLSLNELLTALPHSPTPELIVRLRQSIGHLRALQRPNSP